MSAIFIVKPELAKLVGFETARFFHRIEYWVSKSVDILSDLKEGDSCC